MSKIYDGINKKLHKFNDKHFSPICKLIYLPYMLMKYYKYICWINTLA